MEKVKVYYQCVDKLPLWDFCADAWLGARYQDIPAIPFERIEDVPDSPYHIIVGSVEECTKFLSRNGFTVPHEIDVEPYQERTWHTYEDFMLNDFDYPKFVKPKGNIKAFTGTVVKSKKDFEFATIGYEGDIWASDVLDIKSEWRCYINRGKILKVCHYAGDPAIFPADWSLMEQVNHYINYLPNYDSFCIDFGIIPWEDEGGEDTIIIEGNDAWAIGNYGLEPKDYLNFIKDRWFQLTGLRK